VTKRRLRAAPVLAVAVAASGCFLPGRDYVAPSAAELGIPAAYSNPPAAAHAGDGAAAVTGWWRALGDPMLAELVEEALREGPDVAAARARLREARARRRLAAASLWPQIGVGAGGQYVKSSGDTSLGEWQDFYDAGLDATWEPDLAGGQRRALQGAEADAQAAEASLGEAKVALAAEVARAYVDLRSFRARRSIAEANLASQESTLRLTEWRMQAGLATSLDAEQARTNVEQTRAGIPVLERSAAEAESRLAVLVGTAPEHLRERLRDQVPIPSAPVPPAIGIPADLLRRRPDVAAAERTLAAETARVGEATAARYPSLSLSGSIGLEALSVGALTSGTSLAAAVAGSLAQTLFDAGRIESQIEIRTAVQEQALAAYRTAVLNALREVENALVAISRTRQREQALATAASSARSAATLAGHQYAAGIIDFQTLLDAERTVLSVEESLVATRAESTSAVIQLYEALGGGWPGAELAGADDRAGSAT
jgi:NodT family efflux transporter outer membrane factor (OMF) lipoprotein